jgi:SAM-dependent methyltransferase
MSAVTDHYESLLAEHYSWMFGVSPQVKAAEQLELLTRLQVTGGHLAVDLGAGSGFQSMALVDSGFERVLAIDTSAKLLAELRINCGDRHIAAIQDDLMNIARHAAPGTADAIVCMGDTLTHLCAPELIPRLFTEVWRALGENGRFVLTFRDLSSELRGVDRFIPVRSTADKIMTCFLEFGPGIVMVHDLIHVHDGSRWRLLKSCYPKLRLSAQEIRQELEQTGFTLYAQEVARGMTTLAAQKVNSF